MRRGCRPVVVLGALALTACDGLLTEPAPVDDPIEIRLAAHAGSGQAISYGDLSGAFRAVRSAWFRFGYDGSQRDTVVAAQAVGETVRVRASLRADEAMGWLDVQVELRMAGGHALFRGRTLVHAFTVSPVIQIELTPVVTEILVPRLAQDVSALGDTIDLDALPLFVNGTVVEGLPVAWASDDPTVVQVIAADRAVSRSSGSVALTGAALGFTRAYPVAVRQRAIVLTGIGPADTTMVVGASYQARPFGADRNGFPLLPDAVVDWGAQGAVQIDGNGVVTAVAPGTGTVSATAEGVTRTAQVTVIS